MPTGLSINSSTGVISGTISAGGSFQPTVTVGNGTYSTSASFNWTVSSPITITDDGDQAFNAGDAVSVPITATDTASGTLTFSASGLPSGTSINSSTGLISGTMSSSLSAGIYTSTITVTRRHQHGGRCVHLDHRRGQRSSRSPTRARRAAPRAARVSLTLSASYSGSGTLSYAAEGLPAGLKINPSTGAITGTVGGGDAAFGPYAVTVTATDGTNTDSQTFTWTVTSR